RRNGAGQKVTCYECGAQGHFKRYCPKLKNNNNNHGNQVGTGNAQAKVYAVGNAGINPDANTITDHDYAIELADGRIVGVNTGRETLIFHGDGSNQENEAQLNIISCAKMNKYMLKGCQVFLAHVTTKEAEGKSEKKRLENVPIVQGFSEVFPEDFMGLPPTRQVVFQIDLIPGAAPVARAPYRLAPP
nr:reverse transcriptase domain-containing protein [Tanacetum cinerariifolium]